MNRQFGTPSKSDRIVAGIIDQIREGSLAKGQAIPSINAASERYNVARKTVVRAYQKLADQGFIESHHRRGFFVVDRQPNAKLKVLLLLHSFEAHFEILYNEFRKQVEGLCEIEIYFHHYNPKILELIISRNISDYDMYIISSFNHPKVSNIIGRIPAGKVLIISRNDRLGNKYNTIVQDFFEGTYQSLCSAKEQIAKYRNVQLSFPEKGGHPETLKNAFLQFCNDFSVPHKIVNSLENMEIRKGDAFLVIDDSDLVKLLKVCKIRGWKPGRDVGVISYNETPLKEVIRNGITVISCNFGEMAAEMAAFIKNRISVQKIIPIKLIKRNSF
jgi:DNA-binding transcriptional regulator YhcF (GntR family)